MKKIFIASVVLTLIIARAQEPHAKILKALAAKSSSGVTNIYADFFIDFNASGVATGTVVTLSIATNADRSFVKGPWTYQAGNPPQSNTNLFVWANHAVFQNGIFCDGTSYNLTQTTNDWALTNANYQFLTKQLQNPGPTNSWFFIIRVTESENSVGYNLPGPELGGGFIWSEWIDDPATGYWMAETSLAGGSSQHIGAAGLTNIYLYFTGYANTNLGQSLLFLYTNTAADMSGNWNFVGSSSNHQTLGPGTGSSLFDIGREDVHGNVPKSRFEFIMAGVDYTYAHFPLGPLPWTNAWEPVISSASVNPATTTAIVSWTTDHSANSGVNYGTTSGYGINTKDSTAVQSHTINLSGLTASTTYHYQIGSTNGNNLASTTTDATFTTATPPTYIMQNDFNSGSASAPSGWNADNGSVTWNYTTAPAPLEGADSIKMGTGSSATTTTSLGNISEVWSFSLCNVASSGCAFVHLLDSGGNLLLRVSFSGGEISVDDGGVSASTSGSGNPLSTTLRIWTHYKAGSGANAVEEVWWSTTDTIPLTSDTAHYCHFSNGTKTAAVDKYRLCSFSGSAANNIFDKARVASTVIGSNPP